MSEDSDKLCCVCPQYGREPELCERYPVCETCRLRLAHGLAQIPQQWATLTAEPGSGVTERITGTRDRPLGVRISALDQEVPVPPTLAARTAVGYTTEMTEFRHDGSWVTVDVSQDQTGEIPVAAWLDSCVRDWMTYHDQWQRLPVPTVERLTQWLSVRVKWACDSHPAVDEFAAELRHQLGVLRAVNGDVHAKPEVKIGVICKGCDAKSSLRREAGDDYIECEDCGYLYSPQEYEDWTRMLHGYAKQHYRWDRDTREWVLNEEEGDAA